MTLMALAVGAVVGTYASALAQSDPAPALTIETRTSEPGPPIGVVAIGHSGVMGWNLDPDVPNAPANEFSWATGTAPELRSIYQRIVERIPEAEGHVVNAGAGSAPASLLASQARRALDELPRPAIVLVQTIDGDIRCDGTDEAHVPEFGAAVAKALDVITERSPDSRILVLGQLGRPAGYLPVIEDVPEVVAFLTGTEPCSMFEPSGEVATERVAVLTAIIEAYEAEQSRVCAAYPQCRDDGGLLATWVDTAEIYSDDWSHLSVAGHAAKAEMVWPIVAGMLELAE
jgi:hypothetical protein